MKTFVNAADDEKKRAKWGQKTGRVWEETFETLVEQFNDCRGTVIDREVALRNRLLDLFDDIYVQEVQKRIKFPGNQQGIPLSELFVRDSDDYVGLIDDYKNTLIKDAWNSLKGDKSEKGQSLRSEIR